MIAFTQNVILTVAFLMITTVVAAIIEAIQSSINGIGAVHGFMGGLGFALGRFLSIQLPITIILAFLVFQSAMVFCWKRWILILVLGLVPAISMLAHFLYRDLGFKRYFETFQIEISGPVIGLSVPFTLIFSAMIAAAIIIRFMEKHEFQ